MCPYEGYKDPEKRSEYLRQWRLAHPGYHREKNKEWCAANKEKKAKCSRNWREAHKEEIAKYNRHYRDAHPGYKQSWREENSEKAREYTRHRRARKLGTQVEDIDETFIYEHDRYACVYCGSPFNLTLDHVMALANGGAHSYDNLVVACRSCNSSKRTQEVFQWLALGKHRNRRTTNGNRINI